MSASTIQQGSVLTGRQAVLFVVIGLHALVIGALMTMRIAIDAPAPPPIFKPVTSDIARKPLPPDPEPILEAEPIRRDIVLPPVPGPDIIRPEPDRTGIIWLPPDVLPAGADAGTAATDPAPRTTSLPPTALEFRATRSPDDFYPPASIRLQEEGVAVVRVCVAASGAIAGAPAIQNSSGSRRLDAAAVKWASEALTFTPATRNGEAVAACKGFRVNFALQ